MALSQKDIQQLNTQFQRVIDANEAAIKQATADIPQIKEDIGTLKTDVSTLKSDVSVLKTDVSTLKTDVSVLKTDVGALKTDVHDIKGDIGTINKRLNRLESENGLQLVLLRALQQNMELVHDSVKIFKNNPKFLKNKLSTS